MELTDPTKETACPKWFNDQHADARGLPGSDKDPDSYVEEHR
jgi:hypothetical protein